MNWLEIIRTFWPIAAVITPVVIAAGFLWLKSLFPTKADLKATENGILARIDLHDGRLNDGSKKLADLDKRVAIVEEECESQPSRHELNQGMAVLAGRLSGLESGIRGLERTMGTHHDYIRTLLEKGLQP